MKKILGGLLVASPFVAITVNSIITFGWLATAQIWGAVVLLIVVLVGGIYLLTDG